MKRLLDHDALHAMAQGCAVLGAGGGGDTYYALLQGSGCGICCSATPEGR